MLRVACRGQSFACVVLQLLFKSLSNLYSRSTRSSTTPFEAALLLIMPSTSIESAAIDGRARTPRFIQRQLANLHKAITTNAKIIQDAIVADTSVKLREAQLEIHLSISVVKELYDNFSVEEALSQEYRVARGQDWCDRNDAVGTIYLRPQSHNLVYSIVSPLANAIAAGNCVVIEVRKLESVSRQC